MVLGGYPTDSTFDSYVRDTTALLITFPVNAQPSHRHLAVGWERAFLKLVRFAQIRAPLSCVASA